MAPRPRRTKGGFVRWLLKKIGWSSQSRRVSFKEQTNVFEFERQLLGGGGVPDGDTVGLGLGNRCASPHAFAARERWPALAYFFAAVPHARARLTALVSLHCTCCRSCVNSYLSPLSDQEDKDEYASDGYLDEEQRTKLLTEWQSRPAVKAAIEKARPEIERLQRSRDETALSPRDQRYMPSNMGEALLLASQDEEEAEAARRSAQRSQASRSRATNTRAARGRLDTPSASSAAALALSSPIQKRRFL